MSVTHTTEGESFEAFSISTVSGGWGARRTGGESPALQSCARIVERDSEVPYLAVRAGKGWSGGA